MVREKSVHIAVELKKLALVNSFIDLFMSGICLIDVILLAVLSEQYMYRPGAFPTCSSKTLNLILLFRRQYFQ